jgi:hypothetical protein
MTTVGIIFDLSQSAQMAFEAAKKLESFAVKPLEQSAAAIVEAEKQALEQALKALPCGVL